MKELLNIAKGYVKLVFIVKITQKVQKQAQQHAGIEAANQCFHLILTYS